MQKTEPDKLCKSTTKAVGASKRMKKAPSNEEKLFLMIKEKCSADRSPLLVFHQNIKGIKD
jgi:hypothetical protein